MIAANYPRVGFAGSGDFKDHVVHRLEIPVERDLEMHFCRPNSDVIGQGQGAAPLSRSHWSTQSLKQRLRVPVGNWQDGNLRDGLRIFTSKTLSVRSCADSWREWVTGIAHKVHYAAPLHPIGGTHWTV